MANVPILQTFALHSAQILFLQEIARRAGDGMRFSWDNAREDVRGMVADLLQKQLVKYVEYVTNQNQASGPTFLILTDPGRRVVSQLDAAARKQTEIRSEAPEVKIETPS